MVKEGLKNVVDKVAYDIIFDLDIEIVSEDELNRITYKVLHLEQQILIMLEKL